MKEKSISKIRNIWETQNKISDPNNRELHLDLIDSIASIFAVGKFYYYILNFDTYQMEFVHPNIEKLLGVKPKDYSLDKLLELIHPDDLKFVSQKEAIAIDFLFNRITVDQLLKYKVSYVMRFKTTSGLYKSFLHQAKTLTLSKDGKIQQVIAVHTDISYLNIPIDHKISFIGDSDYPSYFSEVVNPQFHQIQQTFQQLFTKREEEIIKLLTKGLHFREIANYLHISPHTVNTHKRNILQKSNCKNTAEMLSYCLRLGIV